MFRNHIRRGFQPLSPGQPVEYPKRKGVGTDMSDGSISGHVFDGSGRPSRSFGVNRVCKEESCNTRLSRYNSGRYCFEHEPKTMPRTRGKKIA